MHGSRRRVADGFDVPAAQNGSRRSHPGALYSPLALDVLRVVDGTIADIVTFDGSVFGWFGLPRAL